MTRRGCLLGMALWAVIMTLPLCALAVAIRGEVSWQRGPFTEDRVWIVRSDPGSGEEAAGLAYSSVRVTSGRPGNGGPVCARTRVNFWLWAGDSETVDYCECYQPTGGGDYDVTGAC